MFSTLPLASLLALAASSLPAAQACGGHEVRAAGLAHRAKYDAWLAGRDLSKRATTWEDQAALTDPSQECAYYAYEPVTTAKASFPTIWETASIVTGDTEAQTLFNTINATLPSYIAVKGSGSHNGDWSSVSYNATDPDCWWTWNGCVNSKYDYLVSNNVADIYKVPEPETFGLNFDDGPNCTHNAFYDFLKEKDLTASMFYIGSNVLDWPLQAQRGYEEGHEICVHTWSHQYMTSFSNEEAFAELYYTKKAIELVLGVTPTCWRAPFGDVDDRIRTIAYGLGLQHMMWEFDSDDWRVGTEGYTLEVVEQNYDNLIARANNGTFATSGTIMLTHEIRNDTMQLFMDNYDKLAAAFKYLVPIWAAYNVTQIYAESNATAGLTFAEYVDAHGGSVADSTTTASNPSVTDGNAAASGGSASGAAGASSTAAASASASSSSVGGTSGATANAVVGGGLTLAALVAAGSLLAL